MIGANDGHRLVPKVHPFMWPKPRLISLALKFVEAIDIEHVDHGGQPTAEMRNWRVALPGIGGDSPNCSRSSHGASVILVLKLISRFRSNRCAMLGVTENFWLSWVAFCQFQSC